MSRRVPRFSAADAVRECLHTLGARPGRSLLAALSLVMGVGAVVAVMCLRSSSAAAVEEQFQGLGINDVTLTLAEGVLPEGATPATFGTSAVERVRDLPWTESASGVGALGTRVVLVEAFGELTAVSDVAVSTASEGLSAIGAELQRGRWPTSAEERLAAPVAMVSPTLAARLGLGELADLPQVLLDGRRFQIVGVADPGRELTSLSTGMWVPDTTARAMLGATGYDTIHAVARLGTSEALVRDAALAAYPTDPDLVGVESALAARATRVAVGSTLDALTLTLAAIVLAVGGVGIGSMTLVSVLARTQEIAVRRAVGASRGHIFGLVVTEAAILGLVGALAGLALGLVAGAVAARVQAWPLPTLDPTISAVPILAILVAILGGTAPAIRAARIPPALALRAI